MVEFVELVVGQHGLAAKALDAREMGPNLVGGEHVPHAGDEPR